MLVLSGCNVLIADSDAPDPAGWQEHALGGTRAGALVAATRANGEFRLFLASEPRLTLWSGSTPVPCDACGVELGDSVIVVHLGSSRCTFDDRGLACVAGDNVVDKSQLWRGWP
jgi:hypothetical protein